MDAARIQKYIKTPDEDQPYQRFDELKDIKNTLLQGGVAVQLAVKRFQDFFENNSHALFGIDSAGKVNQ